MRAKTTRRGLARLACLAFALVLAVGAGLSLAGCKQAEEQLIRAGLTQSLDALKNPSRESLEPYVSQLGQDGVSRLEGYGIDVYDLAAHVLKGFDYQLGDVSVDGDTATAAVHVRGRDLAPALEATWSGFSSGEGMAELVSTYQDGGEVAMAKKLLSRFYENLDASDAQVEGDVTLDLVKGEDGWQPTKDDAQKVADVLFGNIDLSSLESLV